MKKVWKGILQRSTAHPFILPEINSPPTFHLEHKEIHKKEALRLAISTHGLAFEAPYGGIDVQSLGSLP